MKTYLQLILLSILFLTIGCMENSTEQKTDKTIKQVELKNAKEQQQDSILKHKKTEIPKNYEHKYVTARSGLNYRDSPNGTVLGKFPLNTSLRLIEYTKVTDTVTDRGKRIAGKWVGVQNWIDSRKDSDTVYVFDGFLSSSYTESAIKLYYASSYYREKNGKTVTAFLNVSETFFRNTYNENIDRNKSFILTESNLAKDTITLNPNQRKELLKQLKLSELDKVFVYLTKSDSIITLNIKDLPAVARMNIYGPSNDYENREDDYYFGFDLGKLITVWDNLVFIGKTNPFEIGKLKPIIWTEIENTKFPIYKALEKSDIALNSYMFSTDKHDYFLQEHSEKRKNYHLIIIDKGSKSEVFNRVFYDTEGTYLTGLNIKGNSNEEIHQSQWTGALLKNKATIVFGFLDYSFGCPSITVLDETEPTISILCDNRH